MAAVALGACVIEKHFTLARADGGPDAAFSLEPAEFTALVRDCKDAWTALGRAHYDLLGSERGNAAVPPLALCRRRREGRRGAEPRQCPLDPARATACRPRTWTTVLGRPAARDLARGEPLAWDMLG